MLRVKRGAAANYRYFEHSSKQNKNDESANYQNTGTDFKNKEYGINFLLNLI